ncbi:DUF3237 domain-containing protein [Polyangium sp. 6x1]|uniref:DUF3237 domain-containing protein n=1 Tax=Polyangium sp. 6x1 TaxID=3042689 RepID=UPI002482A33F|nr:DUF3237 domain-containing protein [Polyangium sp. 6x1]MDI1451729.1 DUF3237 domain-containing protein [Polyangium sp. 6x1]
MGLQLTPLGTLTLAMGESITLPNCPSGLRVIVEFPAITWEGERLRARLKGKAAADWIAIGPEGTATLDIRFTMETEDGAVIFVQTHGRTDSAKFAAGAPVYLAPRFETGDARYAWLNRIQAVAKGKLESGAVRFEVHEVV